MKYHLIQFTLVFLKEMMLSNVSSRYSFLPNCRGGEDGAEGGGGDLDHSLIIIK